MRLGLTIVLSDAHSKVGLLHTCEVWEVSEVHHMCSICLGKPVIIQDRKIDVRILDWAEAECQVTLKDLCEAFQFKCPHTSE